MQRWAINPRNKGTSFIILFTCGSPQQPPPHPPPRMLGNRWQSYRKRLSLKTFWKLNFWALGKLTFRNDLVANILTWHFPRSQLATVFWAFKVSLEKLIYLINRELSNRNKFIIAVLAIKHRIRSLRPVQKDRPPYIIYFARQLEPKDFRSFWIRFFTYTMCVIWNVMSPPAVKGSLTRDFRSQFFFFMNQCPPGHWVIH